MPRKVEPPDSYRGAIAFLSKLAEQVSRDDRIERPDMLSIDELVRELQQLLAAVPVRELK